MMDRISYKKKFFAILTVALLLAVLAFYKSVAPTFALKKSCDQMEMELDSGKASTMDLQSVKNELENINNLLGSQKESIETINRGIVDFIGSQSSQLQLTLVDFPPVHSYRQSQFTIYTHQAEVEGNFKGLLELLFRLEHQFTPARVCAVKFYSREEFRTKKKKLYGLFYVQNIRREI